MQVERGWGSRPGCRVNNRGEFVYKQGWVGGQGASTRKV